MYLHLLDPTRDVALCNKSDDILEKELRIPPCWWAARKSAAAACSIDRPRFRARLAGADAEPVGGWGARLPLC